MKKKIYCFDLDNTLCTISGKNYSAAKAKKNAIKTVNYLFEKGHTIKINTARYMGRSNDNLKDKKKLHIKISKQLNKFGIKYHKLFISKPSADIYIDDKAYGYDEAWIKKYKKL